MRSAALNPPSQPGSPSSRVDSMVRLLLKHELIKRRAHERDYEREETGVARGVATSQR
jgi:hypothetical protein